MLAKTFVSKVTIDFSYSLSKYIATVSSVSKLFEVGCTRLSCVFL